MIERAVAVQLMSYIDDNHLGEVFQSAYKKKHSTKTALLKVQDDILMALDNRRTVVLLLLDLSAVFDTVDHSVLLYRLENRFNIRDKALSWFKSSLSN